MNVDEGNVSEEIMQNQYETRQGNYFSTFFSSGFESLIEFNA